MAAAVRAADLVAEVVLLRGIVEQQGHRLAQLEELDGKMRRLARRIRMGCDAIADAAEGFSGEE